uniref:Uncharacterized protein n=1 Tax=Rhizophora mucronata TaxID=61149 RepID=A0A2P2N4Z9_RHIMU
MSFGILLWIDLFLLQFKVLPTSSVPIMLPFNFTFQLFSFLVDN